MDVVDQLHSTGVAVTPEHLSLVVQGCKADITEAKQLAGAADKLRTVYGVDLEPGMLRQLMEVWKCLRRGLGACHAQAAHGGVELLYGVDLGGW